MLGKLEFFWPQEVILVEVECIKTFLCEPGAGCEWGRGSGKWRKGEEQVLGAASDDTEVFGEGGGHGVDLLGHFFVCKYGCRGVGPKTNVSGVRNVPLECVHARRGGNLLEGAGVEVASLGLPLLHWDCDMV